MATVTQVSLLLLFSLQNNVLFCLQMGWYCARVPCVKDFNCHDDRDPTL